MVYLFLIFVRLTQLFTSIDISFYYSLLVAQCLELSWIAILVLGIVAVIFITLMCVHFYNGLF